MRNCIPSGHKHLNRTKSGWSSDPQGHLHSPCSCPCKTFFAHWRQTCLSGGSCWLEAEQEHSYSGVLQGAITVRCLSPALLTAGLTGWKISVRRRKERWSVPGAVGGGSVSSYLPSTAGSPSVCSVSGAISVGVTFVPWSHFPHGQMVQSSCWLCFS